MRALRSFGEKDIRVVDVDEPTPSDDKIIVEVDWCGICGSDLHLFHMGPQAMLSLPKDKTDTTPLIMGHEIAGRITHSPFPATHPVGSPVVLDPRLYCSSCPQCTAAPEPQSQCCANGIGFTGFSTQSAGGFAEKMAVPRAAAHVLPGGADALEDAALVEPLAVAWHAVKRAGIAGPEWLEGAGAVGGKRAAEVAALVVGGGPVGVAVCYVLRAWGVGTVVLSEPAKARREGVRELVDEVVDPVEESVVEIPVPFVPLMYRESMVTASCAYNEKDFEEVVKAFAEGKFKGAESMITARISLEDVVKEGFGVLTEPDNSHVKILVTPKASRVR
ncbi:hypothetical protein SLS57_002519 [Botryosphaeria dothidea]